MIPPFDIFKISEGEPIWIETATALDAAQTRVKELMRTDPREYVILSHKTGNKISVKPE